MYGGDFEMGTNLINVGAILTGGDFAVGRFDQVPTKCMQKNNVTQQL